MALISDTASPRPTRICETYGPTSSSTPCASTSLMKTPTLSGLRWAIAGNPATVPPAASAAPAPTRNSRRVTVIVPHPLRGNHGSASCPSPGRPRPCRPRRSSLLIVPYALLILGVDRRLHSARPYLNVRDHPEPSSQYQLSRLFLVDTRPKHQEVSIGVLDVEREEIFSTGVKQSRNSRLGEVQAVDLFPVEIIGVQVNRDDRLKDLCFLGPWQCA